MAGLDKDNQWTERVASFYSRSAEGYEEMWAPILVALARDLVDELPLDSCRHILDLGSGVGTLLPEIQQRSPSALVVGADLAFGMLRRAPNHFPRVTTDAQRLAFADESFDAAVLAFMLFHVPQPRLALQETRRVLRPGATIGTITWGEDPPYLAVDIWNEELTAHGADPAPELSRHDFVDTEEKVTDMLESCGFDVTKRWKGMHEEQMTAESFLEHRTGHGLSRYRFESIPEDARTDLLIAVRDRLEDLGPKAFLDRAEVIYATATKR